MKLLEPSPELVEQYKAYLEGRHAPATTQRKLSSLRRFFSWLHREGKIKENPLERVSQGEKGITGTTGMKEYKEEKVRDTRLLGGPLRREASEAGPARTPKRIPILPLFLFASSAVVTLTLALLISRRFPIPLPIPGLARIPQEVTSPIPFPTKLPSPSPPPRAGEPSGPEATPSLPSDILTGKMLDLVGPEPLIQALGGPLLLTSPAITLQTTVGSDGDITFAPDGLGQVLVHSSTTTQDSVQITNANLTTGTLIYGNVGNNGTKYNFLEFTSGSNETLRFSVDASGNLFVGGDAQISGDTTIGEDLDIKGNLLTDGTTRLTSSGALTNITGYTQSGGNFTITQTAGDSAKITKEKSATADLLTLRLAEKGVPNSLYDTLVLERVNGASDAYALFVKEGNARFDSQLQLGRFTSNPTSIGQGSLVFNTTDTSLYVWNGTTWVNLSSGGIWQRISGVISPVTVTDDLAIGGTDSTAPFFVNDSGTITFSSDTNLYRSAADTLRTDDALSVGSTLAVTGDTTLTGDLAVNGGDVTTTAATFNLVNAATTVNLGSTAVTRAINIGTGTLADTINIGTDATTGEGISIGNSNASTTVAITGGDDWNITGTGILTLSASAAQTTAILVTDTDYTNALNVGDNNIIGTTANIDLDNFDVTGTTGLITTAGNIAVNGGDITTTSTGTATVFNTNATTLNIGGAATAVNVGASTGTATIANATLTLSNATTLTASSLATFTTAATLGMTSTTALNLGSNVTITSSATALNLQSDGTVDVNLAGGSGTTGCTVTNSNGNLTCSGNITGSSSGTSGFWTRTGTTLSPATANDVVSISSNDTSNAVLALTSTGIASSPFTMTADSVTTGTVFAISADALTTGKGIDLTSTSNAIDSGVMFNVSQTASAATDTTLSSDTANISFSPTYSTAVTTPAISGQVLDISRSVTTNNLFTSTLTLSGVLASFSDSATQTTGTLTSTADVVQIAQNYTANSGAALNITSAGGASGFALRVNDDGTFTDTTPFIIDTAGLVGIGTTTPSVPFEVVGNVEITGTANPVVALDGSATSAVALRLNYGGAGTFGGYIGLESSTGGALITGTAARTLAIRGDSGVAIGGGNRQDLYIDTAGLVGIGTASPGYKLHVYDTTNALKLERTGATNYLEQSFVAGTKIARIVLTGESFADSNYGTGDLTLQTQSTGSNIRFGTGNAGTNQMIITSGGNVGINTTGPDRRLDVLDASNPQLRLTQADGTQYGEFQVNSSGNLTTTLTGTTLTLRPSTLNTNDFQIAQEDGTVAVILAHDPLTRNNQLTAGNWIITNPSGGNVGQAALMVNQAVNTTNDIFTASSSGVTQATIDRTGDYINSGNKNITTISNTNDVFVYDTTKDSDGGRWINDDRARASSWYNETIDASGPNCDISTNDRCGSKEFPKRAIIVATTTNVYIYDAKDNTMWMRFDEGSSFLLSSGGSSQTAVFALNGRLYIAMSADGVAVADFVGDETYRYDTNGKRGRASNNSVSGRNAATAAFTTISWGAITGNAVNDVHAAVANGKTYVAAATDTGVSVINEADNLVKNFTDTGWAATVAKNVWVTSDKQLYFSAWNTTNTYAVWRFDGSKLDNGTTDLDANEDAQYSADCTTFGTCSIQIFRTPSDGTERALTFAVTQGTSTVDGNSNTVYIGSNGQGTAVIQEKDGGTSDGSYKLYTKDFISDEMIGDIRGMWPLNNTLSDASVKANTLTNNNSTTITTSGVRGQAATFNGTNQWLSVADNASLSITGTAISMGVWIERDRTAAVEQLMGKWGAGQDSYQFRLESADDKIRFKVEAPGNAVISNTALTSTTSWYYVVGTYDGTTLKIYVNGVLDNSASASTTLTDKTASFSLGRNDDGSYFQGSLDEPFVTAETLTAGQIKHMYEVGRRALQNHTASRITEQATADNYQQLLGSTNVTKAVAVDDYNRYIYVGTRNTTTSAYGALSVVGTDSDTLVDGYSNASTGKSDDSGTAYSTGGPADIAAVSVTGSPVHPYNSGTNIADNKAILAIGGEVDCVTTCAPNKIWMQSFDFSLNSVLKLASPNLIKNSITVAGGPFQVVSAAAADFNDFSSSGNPNFGNSSAFYTSFTGTHTALILENADVVAGLELETQTATVADEAILNLGVMTERGIPLKSGATNPDAAWFRIDTRSSSKQFAWFWEASGGSTESNLMQLTSTGKLTVTNSNTGGTKFIDFVSAGGTVMDVYYPANGLSPTGPNTGTDTVMHIWRDATSGRSINAAGTVNINGADYAEYFYQQIPGDLETGDLVCLSLEGKAEKCVNGKSMVGVVSSNPGFVGNDIYDQKNPHLTALVGIVGQVQTRVSTENGPIEAGDFLTSSSTPGIAMKATRAGPIIGKAFEPFDGSNDELLITNCSNQVPSTNDQLGQLEIRSIRNSTACGRILTFVNVGWYDPDVYLTDSGDLRLVSNDQFSSNNLQSISNDSMTNENSLEIKNWKLKIGDEVIDRVGAFGELIVASLKAGVVQTQELVAEKKIISPVVETSEIRTGGEDLVIDLSNHATIQPSNNPDMATWPDGQIAESGFGKLIVQGDVEIQGNATISGELRAESLEVSKDANVAGTIYADEIIARRGTFGDLLAQNISADTLTRADLDEVNNKMNELQSSLSGISSQLSGSQVSVSTDNRQTENQQPTPEKLTLAEIEDLLSQVEVDQKLMSQANDWSTNVATDSASLANGLQTTDYGSLPTTNILGNLATVGSVYVGSDLIIQQSTIQPSNNPDMAVWPNGQMVTAINTLSAPLSIQSLAAQPLYIMGDRVQIATNGDVVIKGNLTVEGKLAINTITPLPNQNLVIDLDNQLTSESANQSGFGNLLIKGAGGATVASINASGSARFADVESRRAQFAQVETEKLVIATDNTATNSGTLAPGEIQTNATAGQAVLPANVSQITIKSPFVTDNTLVYVTPLSSTLNNVLYVKSKQAGEFTVGFDNPVAVDVKFNWWVIELQNTGN